MKGLVVLLALFGAMDDSDFDRTPGGLMVTGANIFAVNKAERISPEGVIKVFSEAFISKHKFKDQNLLVFEKGARISLRKATAEQVKNDSELKQGDTYVDEKEFMQSLKSLQLQMESNVTLRVPKSEIKKVEDLIHATQTKELRKLVLVGNSMMSRMQQATVEAKDAEDETKVPVGPQPVAQQVVGTPIESRVSDRSIIIEWGNPQIIDEFKKSLEAVDEHGDSLLESKIYDLHYYKLPLRAEVFLSQGDAIGETKPVAKKDIQPMFLVRSRFEDKKPAYLLYISAAQNGARRIVALEVPRLEISENDTKFDFDLDATCFADQVIRPEMGKSLSFPEIDESFEESMKAGTVKNFSVGTVGDGKDQQKRLFLHLAFSKPSAGADISNGSPDATRVFFNSKDPNESWSVKLGTAEDVTPPFGNNLSVRVYDSKCDEHEVNMKLGSGAPGDLPVTPPPAASGGKAKVDLPPPPPRAESMSSRKKS